MNFEQRETLLFLEEILADGDKAKLNTDLGAQLAWLIDVTSVLKWLIDYGKNDSAFRDLIFTTHFASHIRDSFPSKLRRKLRKCEGEGQMLLESMVNKIEEFRENAEEELNKLDIALYGDDAMATVDEDSTADSGTKSMAEVSENDAEKIEINLEDEVGFDDSKAYKAVVVDEYEQLGHHKVTTADADSFDGLPVSISEPQKEFNARFLSEKEVEHNLGEQSRDNKEVEELVKTFEDMNGGLDYKFDVIGEADHNNEEESPDENSEVAAEDLPYPTCSTYVVDADGYSETTFEKPRMFSEVESKNVRLLFEGTFLKNSDEILKNLDKFPVAEVVTKLEAYDSVQENYGANLDIKDVFHEIGEGMKQDEATKDVKEGEDDLKLSKIAKNLKDKVGHDDAIGHKAAVFNEKEFLDDSKAIRAEINAYEDSTPTMFLPRIDLNAEFVKEEVEHESDGTSEDFNDFEYPAFHSPLERASVEDDPSLNGDQKKDDALVVIEKDEDEVSAKESFVMKTVRIFKNKKYVESKKFKIQGNDKISSAVKEIINENQMNDASKNTEDDVDDYVNVHGEILNASNKDLIERVPRDYKEVVRDDDEITAKEVDHPIELEDILDTYEETMIVDAKEYFEASPKKPRKSSDHEINVVNLQFEDVHVSNPALEVEILDIKNILDFVVKAKNQDKSITDYYDVDVGHKKPATNEAPRSNCVKEPEADITVFVSLLMHLVAKLDMFKRFPRFLWRPGDPSYPSYSVLKNIFTQLRPLMLIPRVLDELCISTIAVLDLSFTDVDKQEEPMVMITQMSEYDAKLSEKANKEVGDNIDELVMKLCKSCCCSPYCVLNEQEKTDGTLEVDVELSKEFLLPDLLDRTWDQLKDYKVQMFDDLPMVQDKLVSVLPATQTDQDQNKSNAEEDQLLFSASANTSDIMSILQDLLAGKDISLLLAGASYQVRVSRIVYSTYLSHPRTMITAVW